MLNGKDDYSMTTPSKSPSRNGSVHSSTKNMDRDISQSHEKEEINRTNLFRKLKQDSVNVKEKMANLSTHISSGFNIISNNIIPSNENGPMEKSRFISNSNSSSSGNLHGSSTGNMSLLNYSNNNNYNNSTLGGVGSELDPNGLFSPRIQLPPPVPSTSSAQSSSSLSSSHTNQQHPPQHHHPSHSGPASYKSQTPTPSSAILSSASPVLSVVFDRKTAHLAHTTAHHSNSNNHATIGSGSNNGTGNNTPASSSGIRNVQQAIQKNPIIAAALNSLGSSNHTKSTGDVLTADASSSSSGSVSGNNNSNGTKYEMSDYRNTQFEHILHADIVDMSALRKLAWNGIPPKYRCLVWQLLLSYAPTNKSRREYILNKKRQEYHNLIPVYFNVSEENRSNEEIDTSRQILKDLPRTCPDSPFFQQEPIQKLMERILFIWSIRHPACGYVQGMDDLLTPILYLSMQPYVPTDQDVLRVDVGRLDTKILNDIEADTYWCFTKLLDNIHDHFIFSQPGLQRMILLLEDLIHRLDTNLFTHFQTESLQYMQFGFRWMNCLLIRELPFQCILRLWDTYLSEQYGGFENFHVYVCAVLLKTFQQDIIKLPYEELLMFLQDMPTKDWQEEDMEPILSQAFILSSLFDNSPNHLN